MIGGFRIEREYRKTRDESLDLVAVVDRPA
jgi:hypothetical protein